MMFVPPKEYAVPSDDATATSNTSRIIFLSNDSLNFVFT
jgi:hypothetical protein